MSTDDARGRALAAFRSAWGEPELIVRAPGRVNIIGEHTDYNDGFVLPMALPFDTVAVVGRDPDGGPPTVRSEGFGEVRFDADVPDWAIYMALMRRRMADDGVDAGSWRATVATDIPAGASLSSSAAIEVAIGLVIATLADAPLSGLDIARYGQAVETELLGAPTGIMDQLISATAEAGSASLIDCRTLSSTPRPIPAGAAIVVMDTMTRRELVDSEFPARMDTCRRAAELLGVPALRDAVDASSLAADHPVECRRARHVIAENARTLAAADAMAAGDATELGRLMTESHASLRDDYEVSGPALDAIVDIALAAPGCLGARMTGGGFAGCAVALVDETTLGPFLAHVEGEFVAAGGETPRLWPCKAAPGASVERL